MFDKKVSYAEYRLGKLREKMIPYILPQMRVIPVNSFVNEKGNRLIDFGKRTGERNSSDALYSRRIEL